MEIGGDDRDASLRRKLAEVLARRSDTLILATATPHDGNDRSFASICELLDPSLAVNWNVAVPVCPVFSA